MHSQLAELKAFFTSSAIMAQNPPGLVSSWRAPKLLLQCVVGWQPLAETELGCEDSLVVLFFAQFLHSIENEPLEQFARWINHSQWFEWWGISHRGLRTLGYQTNFCLFHLSGKIPYSRHLLKTLVSIWGFFFAISAPLRLESRLVLDFCQGIVCSPLPSALGGWILATSGVFSSRSCRVGPMDRCWSSRWGFSSSPLDCYSEPSPCFFVCLLFLYRVWPICFPSPLEVPSTFVALIPQSRQLLVPPVGWFSVVG